MISSCLENELFEEQHSVLFASISMPHLGPTTDLGTQYTFVEWINDCSPFLPCLLGLRKGILRAVYALWTYPLEWIS